MEYAGYVRRGAPTDWSKVTGGIAKRLGAVEEGREKEREKLDKLFTETTKIVGDVEMGMNPEFNETILYTADRGRQLVYDAYKKLKSGQIQPREYRNIQNNVQARWAEYDTAVKQKNSRFATIEERTRKGTNSERELWQNQQIAEMESFKDYSLEWGSDGNLVYAKRDDKGNVIPGSIMPISALNKTPNVLVDRFNLTEKVGKYKKNFGAFEIEKDGYILGGSAVDEDKLEAAKKVVIGSIFTTDNDYGDALIDSTYDAFALYKEGAEVPEGTTDDGVALGIKMIFDKQSSTWTAVPTDKQKAYIREKAGQAIDTMLGYKKREAKDTTTKTERKHQKTARWNYETAVSASQGHNLDRLDGYKVGDWTIDGVPVDQGDSIRINMVKGTGKNKEYDYRNVPKGDAIKMMHIIANSKNYGDAKTDFEEGRGLYMGAHEGKEFTIEEAELQPLPSYKFSGYNQDTQEEKLDKYRELQEMQTGGDVFSEEKRPDIARALKTHIWEELVYVGADKGTGRALDKDDITVTFASDGQGATIKIEGMEKSVNVDLDFSDFYWDDTKAKPEDMAAKIEEIVNAYIDQENVLRKAGKEEDDLDPDKE